MADDWWTAAVGGVPAAPSAPPPPVAPTAPANDDWWSAATGASTAASAIDGPNSSPPMDRPGDPDYSPPRPRRDMSKLGAGLAASGALPATKKAKPDDWWNAALGIAGDTFGGTGQVIADTLGEAQSGVEKNLGGLVRGVGQALQARPPGASDEGFMGLGKIARASGKLIEGLGSEAEYMGGRQAEEAGQRLAGKPGVGGIAQKVVAGVPMLTDLGAGGAAMGPAGVTAAMGAIGAGSGLQGAEEAGATPGQAATAAVLQGAGDAALGQIATVPLLRNLLHGAPVADATEALLKIAKQGGLGALQSIGMDVLHGLSRKLTYARETGLSAGDIARNATAQSILQAVFEMPAVEMMPKAEAPATPPSQPEAATMGPEHFAGLNAAIEAERAAPPPIADRRVDLATRRRVDEMSPEEMRTALHTSEITGLPGNKRAFDEALAQNPNQAQAAIDLDSLKAVNDRFGHDAGTQLISTLHQAMQDAGVNGYHLHGDEFAVLGEGPEHVAQQMQQLNQHLESAGAHLQYEAPDGKSYQIPLGFSFGIGEGPAAADSALLASKAAREASGERAPRGATPPGIRELPAEGGPPPDGGTEATATQAPLGDGQGDRGVLGQRFETIGPTRLQRYSVTGLSAEELARADADKTGNYVPRESILGQVQAPTEREAIDQLRQRVAAGEFPRDAQLAGAINEKAGTAEEVQQEGRSPAAVPQGSEATQERQAGEGILAQEGRTTSLKNAVTSEERIARGLPEVELAARKSSGEQWVDAKRQIAEDPEMPQTLAKSIIAKPRSLSSLENDILLHDRMRITLDHRDALGAEEAALAKGDDGELTVARVRRAAAEAQMDINDQAARVGGREWGLAGLARQKLIAEDYSPVNLIRRAKVAGNGKEVPAGIRERLTNLSKQLEEAQARAAVAEEQTSQREAEKVVAREARSAKRGADKKSLDQEYADLAKEFAKRSSTPRAGLDPELAAIVAKMAKNRVQAGARGLGELVDGIFNDIKPHVEDLEPRDVRDAISGYGRTRGHQTHSEATVELNRIKQQARIISRLEDLGDGTTPPKIEKRPDTPEVAALRKKLQETQKDLGGKPRPTDEQRLINTKKRLEARIKDAERGTAPARPREPLADTEETAALRERLKATLKEQGLWTEPGRREMTDAQRLNALKGRLAKRQAELEDQLATNNFTKKARRPLALDQEAMDAQARVQALKNQADRVVRSIELQNRTGQQKALDWTVKWARAVKLSGLSTLLKIGMAASQRTFLFTPIEEAIGGVLSRVPGVSRVAARAPIEGGSDVASVVRSFAEYFSKATGRDMMEHLKLGEGSLDLDHSKKPNLDPASIIDFFGHLHAAIKTPPKRAAFRLAMEKQALYYLGKGVDITDPSTQAEMNARAYEYANRQIFMHDNPVVKAFRGGVRVIDQSGLHKTAAAANILFPIVKVPTNYAAEVGQYLTGLSRGTYKVVDAIRKGVDSLPLEEADQTMRLLKKGSFGAGLIALGAAGFQGIQGGGFYKKGEHRDKSAVQEGDIRIFGVEIPHLLLHHPAIEALQVGANLARVMKHYGTGAAIQSTGMGLAEQIPFFEEPIAMARAEDSTQKTSSMVGQVLRGATIPPDVQKAARIMDEGKQVPPIIDETGAATIPPPPPPGGHTAGDYALKQLDLRKIETQKRKPADMFKEPGTGLLQELEVGLPGLRKNVPPG